MTQFTIGMRGFFCVLLMANTTCVSGASYSMDWCLPGCGTATNASGEYILVSSIGQTDAIIISKDAFQLVGGFWYNQVEPLTGRLPNLVIWKVDGELRISWAPALPGCWLEQSVDSSLSDWTDAPLGNPLIVETPEYPIFFRLNMP